MPWDRCTFCRRDGWVDLWYHLCEACHAAHPDPRPRLDEMIAAGEISVPKGSLVYRPE